ncbi:alkaline phosphatase [Laceyella sacchari]|uniref:Membrane protein DedA, SNARE-associated domain n=1 Tax=Laceyella tengchongensis TaxID=574699 RepID=A0AA45WJL8_9BACL|nr:DedA family protein [Laceyella tengchongensis]AUS08213.1 alkaline phosphatase [Laceyella sacchari]MRG28063.1 DedA family protein [Laceyella tengchongensis]SMP03859.1 membrane protein DedA, SNARE-associated domain [Laceyella tengchongensis]
MESWIIDFMEEFGYLGIFLMIALENIFPPIPSEIVLSFGGFMTTQSDLTVTGVVISSTLGAVVGAIILFYIGRLLDVERLERIVERWGHLLRTDKEDIHKANAWFHRYGIWTVFFCRMVPIVRSLISIPAGMAKMNFPLFLLFTTVGSLIWNMVLVNLGAALGASWSKVLEYMSVYQDIVIVIVGALLIVGAVWFFRRNRSQKA